MIYYELKIESEGDTIEITEPDKIFFAKVSFDTTSENVQKKSNAILARLFVRGKIDRSTNESLMKISEWARDLTDTTTYRTVSLTIKDSETTTLRTYDIPDMFVCDYNEVYGDPKDEKEATFFLKLTQRENRLKDFNTY